MKQTFITVPGSHDEQIAVNVESIVHIGQAGHTCIIKVVKDNYAADISTTMKLEEILRAIREQSLTKYYDNPCGEMKLSV